MLRQNAPEDNWVREKKMEQSMSEQSRAVMLPVISQKEFCEHIEDEDFPIRYGNPVLIDTDSGHSLVCMTAELYERLMGEI